MKIAKAVAQQDNYILLHMLDKGINDMLANRELPLEQAFIKITELRKKRDNVRTQNPIND